jgi:SAM-dependent MidA family methyltransferase
MTKDVPMSWHASLEDVPDGPLIILANEFIDALPVHQAVMCADGWHERVVKLREDGRLQFGIHRDPIPLFEEFLPAALRGAGIGQIFEWRSDRVAHEIARRVVRWGGLALILDYGHVRPAIGETLQAVRGHDYADPLEAAGLADLTAHVDFNALAQAAEAAGARVHGPVTQATFLRRIGIRQRAAVLKASAPADSVGTIEAALQRLTNEDRVGMGSLIKAMAFSSRKVEALPGFVP